MKDRSRSWSPPAVILYSLAVAVAFGAVPYAQWRIVPIAIAPGVLLGVLVAFWRLTGRS